jgi:hypothetical protein
MLQSEPLKGHRSALSARDERKAQAWAQLSSTFVTDRQAERGRPEWRNGKAAIIAD